MKVITFEDIKRLNINTNTCLEWVEDALKNKEKAILPAKISIKPTPDSFLNVMPCVIPDKDRFVGGVKLVTRNPKSEPSLNSEILLLDASTGEQLAILDGNWITAYRTAAVAIHSLLLFAKSNYKTIAVMGLGNIARVIFELLHDIIDRDVEVKLLEYKGQEKLFKEKFKNYEHYNFSIVKDTKDLVKGSDVVISCISYAEKDLCPDEYYEDGVLVLPVHTRGFMNCDLFFDKIYADDTNHVCHFGNFNKFKDFSEVVDVLNKKHEGRKNDKEKIMVYNIGIGMHDTYFALNIYNMLKDANLPEVDLKNPVEKFWA